MTRATSKHYATRVWSNDGINAVIRETRKALKGIEYNAFVGRGLSGSLMAAHLAKALKKELIVVRKLTEIGSTDSHGCNVEGYTSAKSVIIIDDFISSGHTIHEILKALKEFPKMKVKRIVLYERGRRNFQELDGVPIIRLKK